MKVTFNIPKDAAEKLARLAEAGDEVLRELGILSLQMEGGQVSRHCTWHWHSSLPFQVISMTMANNDSDSDDERPSSSLEPTPSTPKSSPPKVKLSPKEETPVKIKQEVEVVATQASSAEPGRPPGTKEARESPASVQSMQGLSNSVAAAAMLMKNLPSSAASLLLPADQSVLSSYSSGGQPSKEHLLASLIARGKEGQAVSPLLGHLLRDSDEPASKKARKTELPSTCVKSTMDSANYSQNRGFSLLPVSSAQSTSLRLTGSQSSSSVSEPLRTSPVGSALRLASLPGVSLTAVSSRNTPSNPPASSHRLMPPPSSAVTLSPVPRTNSVSVTPSTQTPVQTTPAELRCIETGDNPTSVKPSPIVHSVDISPSKQSLSPKVRPALLINPVTGQFEAGSGEVAPESDADAAEKSVAAANEPDSSQEDRDRRTKHRSGSESPGNSTSEQPLRIKLKMPIPNNSSKNLVTQKNDVVKNNVPTSKQADEPKVPKIKIRIGGREVKVNNDEEENHNSNDVEESSTPEKSNSPIPNDVKVPNDLKVKIKPLGSKSPLQDKEAPLSNGPSFPNSIANHTSENVVTEVGRKKKVVKKEKKDRLAIWTESLAKHGEKKDDKKEDIRNKETKTWPEVLESRLYGSSGSPNNTNSIPANSSSSGLPFNKSDEVLENQEEKGEFEQYSTQSDFEFRQC